MTMSTKYPKVRNRKVLLAAVVAIAVVLSGTIVAYQAISSASAVQSTNMTALPGNKPVPMINGSINVIQTTKNIIKDNLKVSFSQAAGIAEKQVTNGTCDRRSSGNCSRLLSIQILCSESVLSHYIHYTG